VSFTIVTRPRGGTAHGCSAQKAMLYFSSLRSGRVPHVVGDVLLRIRQRFVVSAHGLVGTFLQDEARRKLQSPRGRRTSHYDRVSARPPGQVRARSATSTSRRAHQRLLRGQGGIPVGGGRGGCRAKGRRARARERAGGARVGRDACGSSRRGVRNARTRSLRDGGHRCHASIVGQQREPLDPPPPPRVRAARCALATTTTVGARSSAKTTNAA